MPFYFFMSRTVWKDRLNLPASVTSLLNQFLTLLVDLLN